MDFSKTPEFRFGYKCFFSGDLDNPYPEGGARAKRWELGFNAAYFANLQRVKEREAAGIPARFSRPRV